MGRLWLSIFLCVCLASHAAANGFITLQSTTSTQNSGLFDHILPDFTAASGIRVRVVAVGTGQALRNAANGDADVLLVHARAAEEDFVAQGHGLRRWNVMYNDFVIVGSPSTTMRCAPLLPKAIQVARSVSTYACMPIPMLSLIHI